MKFSSYKKQYRANLTLAGPVILSQVGQVLVQVVDNAMVGKLGTLPLAAVSFGGSVFFILFIFGMGLTMGSTPLVGESYARTKHRNSAIYLQNSLLLYGLVAIVVVLLQFSLIPLMSCMGQSPDVVAQAIPYYKYLVWSIFPFMLFAAFKQFLEGVGNTKVSMFIVITANIINIFLNWLFIYGNWGFPRMGAAGAGLATMIARFCMPLMIVVYFWKKDSFKRYFTLFRKTNFGLKPLSTLFSMGFPISMQLVMEGGAFAFSSIMMGWIGTVEQAANQVTMSISNFAFMILIGIASATTIRVSHEYGRGNLKGVNMAANASYHIGMVYNTITALLFIALRRYIPMIFTNDPAVIEMASRLLIFCAAFQICDGLQLISVGILRGMKDVNHIMLIAFISYILINIPLTLLFAFVLNMGPEGIWLGFVFGLGIAALLLNLRYRRQYKKLRIAAEHR